MWKIKKFRSHTSEKPKVLIPVKQSQRDVIAFNFSCLHFMFVETSLKTSVSRGRYVTARHLNVNFTSFVKKKIAAMVPRIEHVDKYYFLHLFSVAPL